MWASNYTDFLISSGRFKEALNFSLKNYEQDKKNIANWDWRGYYYMNQPEKAQAVLDSAWLVFKEPGLFWDKAWLSLWLGKYQETIDDLNKYFEAYPDAPKSPREQTWFAISYFFTGRINETEKILDTLKMRSKKSPVGSPSFHIGMIYSVTGRKESALQWLQKAYKDHEAEVYWLKVDPMFKPLHNDPRFQNLLKKIGFPE
jgi:tetratricopeptide (TPR) repeat protein